MDKERFIRDLFSMVELLREKLSIDRGIKVSEIPMTYYMIIGTIYHFPGISITELADHLNVSQPNCSRSIKKIEEQGYLAKIPDPDDKRIYTLSLTDKGRELINRHTEILNQQILSSMEKYDQEKLEELKQAIDQVLEVVKKL